MDTLCKVLLEVSHGIVGSTPDVGHSGSVVEPLQFPIEVGVDKGESEQVKGVGELMDGDIFASVSVIAVAEGVLFR